MVDMDSMVGKVVLVHYGAVDDVVVHDDHEVAEDMVEMEILGKMVD